MASPVIKPGKLEVRTEFLIKKATNPTRKSGIRFKEDSHPYGGASPQEYSDGENDIYGSDTCVPRYVPNPYNVPTEPKKEKPCRSCPGTIDSPNHSRHIRRRVLDAAQRGEHRLDDSFRTDISRRKPKQQHPFFEESPPHVGIRRPPLVETGNHHVTEISLPAHSKRGGGGALHSRVEDSDDDGQEWNGRDYIQKLQRYEHKCRELTARLQISLSNEKVAKKKKAYYQQLWMDMENKAMEMQAEIQQLRTTVYGLQTELDRSRRMLCQQRTEEYSNHYPKLGRQAHNNSWLTAQSRRPSMQPPIQLHPHSHHTLGAEDASPRCPQLYASVLSNTATPASTANNDFKGGFIAAPGTSSTNPFLIGNGNSTIVQGNGSGEGMAEMSLTGLSQCGLLATNPSEWGPAENHVLASLSINGGEVVGKQPPSSVGKCSAMRAACIGAGGLGNGNLLTSEDEVKNFRRHFYGSFSGSSSGPTARFNSMSEASSVEVGRSRAKNASDFDTSALQISASCDANLSARIGDCGLLIKDDGYSTSGTVRSSVPVGVTNNFLLNINSSQTLQEEEEKEFMISERASSA